MVKKLLILGLLFLNIWIANSNESAINIIQGNNSSKHLIEQNSEINFFYNNLFIDSEEEKENFADSILNTTIAAITFIHKIIRSTPVIKEISTKPKLFQLIDLPPPSQN